MNREECDKKSHDKTRPLACSKFTATTFFISTHHYFFMNTLGKKSNLLNIRIRDHFPGCLLHK